MRLLERFCVLLFGLAMALAMSSVVRADAVTDWNAIAIQISNAPCRAAPCANRLGLAIVPAWHVADHYGQMTISPRERYCAAGKSAQSAGVKEK